MATNTLETAYTNGQVVDASNINEITSALTNTFVGRNTSGVPEAGKALGTSALPWGSVHADAFILNGQAVDASKITSLANRVVSGRTRADSSQPDFLEPSGVGASFTLKGLDVNLNLAINAIATTVSIDIVKTGLTLAASTNNTCTVAIQDFMNGSIYAGEIDAKVPEIKVTSMGSEIAAKIGSYVGLRTPTGEVMLAFVKDSTTLSNCFRGWFFDELGAPTERGVLNGLDSLELINLGYIFVEDNGTTVDVSYLQPIVSYSSPSSPDAGQYWFDISNQVWKRYSGIEFEVIDRIYVGMIGMDSTACVVSRSVDFTREYSSENNIDLIIQSSEIVASRTFNSIVSVYGKRIAVDLTRLTWNITTDLEVGQVEASSTDYYLYLSENAQLIISNIKPYKRVDLNGFYHPHHTWRAVGSVFNNASNDLVSAKSEAVFLNKYPVNVGPMTILGTTTAPTKASNMLVDKIVSYNVGPNINKYIYTYKTNTTVTGASAGSGDYLFKLPNGHKFNSDLVDFYTGDIGSTTGNNMYWRGIGNGTLGLDGVKVTINLGVIPYDNEFFRVYVRTSNNENTAIRSGNFNTLNANMGFTIEFEAFTFETGIK